MVFFLLPKAMPHHGLCSAFTWGSIRGWIYLEVTMNNDLMHHLTCTPGIICTQQTGPVHQQIDFEDWAKMLRMQDLMPILEVGQWVQMCKGTYKGDVGVVEHMENWGGVCLLLVPHSKTFLKRKHSQPALFDPIAISCISQVKPSKQNGDVYLFQGNTFDHELILLPFDAHSVLSTSVQMSSSIFFSFQQSLHSVILSSSPPCPSDWNFTTGE